MSVLPESVEPGLSPGGIVVLVFDLHDQEITRSVLSIERESLTEMLALDAGGAVQERGGGRMICYDGDSGERLLKGPLVVLNEDGERLPTVHDIEDFDEVAESIYRNNERSWPWHIIGVFPTEDTEEPQQAWWNYFCYTVGFQRGAELWVPCCSIEGRCAHPELIGTILNRIAAGGFMGFVNPGDTVRVPLGVQDGDDVNTMWWLGDIEPNDGKRSTYQSHAQWVLPILWSSGMGWPEDET